MIIQCEQCETTYNFDPECLHSAETGAREVQVRCVRCGHIFNVDAKSDLSASSLNPEFADAAPQQDEKEGAAQDVISEEPHDTPGPEPTAEFSGAAEKTSDAPLEPATAPSSSEDFHFTPPGEFSLEPSAIAPEPASDTDAVTNEFIFEPLQAQDHVAEPAGAGEEGSPDIPEMSISTAAAKGGQKKKTSKLLLFVLLLVFICAGIYAYYFVVHGATSVPQVISSIEEQIHRILDPHTEPSGPSIQIHTKDNFYISNNQLGSIFVINGTVTNTSEQPQGEIAVTATLYSASGTPLKSIKVYCGNPISKEALRTEPSDFFQKHMDNKLGAELSNVSVQPGESIPFSVVFHHLPENFAEFSVIAAPLGGIKN